MLIVQKYGGTSLADAQRIRRAAQRAADLARQGQQVVMVVSAQGHTTDVLVEKAEAQTAHPPARELDALLSCGEQMSAALMAMTLADMGCKAVSLTGWQAGILTDSNHGDARILGLSSRRLQTLLDEGYVVVVTGFQGVDAHGNITTLGRGGSDTTAVALAAFLKADSCDIYTDVDGVYDKDPRQNADAVRFDRIDYDAMLALARSGAQVLHDRCVELARDHGVKIRVLSSFREGPGTLVERL